jgi:hypothetical protein
MCFILFLHVMLHASLPFRVALSWHLFFVVSRSAKARVALHLPCVFVNLFIPCSSSSLRKSALLLRFCFLSENCTFLYLVPVGAVENTTLEGTRGACLQENTTITVVHMLISLCSLVFVLLSRARSLIRLFALQLSKVVSKGNYTLTDAQPVVGFSAQCFLLFVVGKTIGRGNHMPWGEEH